MTIDELVEVVVQMLLRIPLCLAEKPTKNASPPMVQRLARFLLVEFFFVIQMHEFITFGARLGRVYMPLYKRTGKQKKQGTRVHTHV